MSFSTTADVVDFVFESFNRVGHLAGPDSVTRRPDLTRALLRDLGQPAADRPAVLIAGSKGKGSTSVLTARILEAAGHRVGLITSPHLVDFRERIRLNGRAIPEGRLIALANELAPAARRISDRLEPPAYLSPTGIVLALGLRYFAEAGATVLVLEAGRGGAYDDMNVAPHQVAVLTPIYLEHREQLGRTVAAIATTKAGIITRESRAVIGRQSEEASRAIVEHCAAVGAPAYWLGRDFRWRDSAAESTQAHESEPGRQSGGQDRESPGADQDKRPTGGTETGQTRDPRLATRDSVTVETPVARYDRLPVPLLGRHQADNLAVALTAAEALEPRLAGLDRATLRAALSRVRWPGRIDVLGRAPLIVADGAINEESARLTLDAIGAQLSCPVIAVTAVPADKDLAGVCRALAPVTDHLLLTRTTLNRTLRYSASAAQVAGSLIERVTEVSDPAAALETARRLSGPNGSILILGTQSLIAETLLALGRNCLDLW